MLSYLSAAFAYLDAVHPLMPMLVTLSATYILAAAYFIFVGPPVRIFEPVPGGRQGGSGPMGIKMARAVDPRQSWIGVLAQELYEFQYKWTHFHLPRFSEDARREMELFGHTVECVAAVLIDGHHRGQYERLEAQSMIDGYPELFAEDTVDTLLDAFDQRRDAAREWVEDNRKWLLKQRARLIG